MRKGNKQAAREVAKDESYGFSTKTSQFGQPHAKKSTKESDISIEKIYENPDNSDSELNLTIVYTQDDREQYAFLDWALDEAANFAIDSAGPKDGVAISFSSDVYTNVKGEQSGSNRVAGITPNLNGVRATNNDEYLDSDEGWLDASFVTKQNEVGNYTAIYGQYIHTWDPFGVPSSLGASFALPGAGQFSVSITGGAKKYTGDVMQNHTSAGSD